MAADYAFPLLQAKNNRRDYRPSVSVILVQLGSNYRLFKEK